MKKLHVVLLTVAGIVSFASGCRAEQNPSVTDSTLTEETSEDSSSIPSSTSSSSASSSSTSSGPKKVTVPAHTLKDSNPPIDVNKKGEIVDKTTWDSFRNAPDSKFAGNYNFTYSAYSGGYQTLKKFTKNGYYMSSISGELIYERKSGSKFYQYIDVSDGWLREETTLDIQNEYVSVIQHEIYVHMFDFENYEYWEDDNGTYRYITTAFGCGVRFQGGYITYMFYALGMNIFELKASFETEIDIPKSYYYE